MKDNFGTEIEVGDIVLSAATREGGHFRVGKVTKLYKDGSPGIIAPTKKYIGPGKGFGPAWYRGPAGSNVLVLSKGDEFDMPARLADRIMMDYEADAPDLG